MLKFQKSAPLGNITFLTTDGETRTLMSLTRWNLNLVRLPISPHPRINYLGNNFIILIVNLGSQNSGATFYNPSQSNIYGVTQSTSILSRVTDAL